MAANGISTLATKQAKQIAKLNIAEAKRQGKVVAANGTITGSIDDTKTYYRAANTLNTARLPTLYSGNTLVDNVNTVDSVNGVLVEGRPWSTVALGVVDTLGFFENQLIGGTYMSFNETISGVTVQAITTNFNGVPTNGSYMKVNGVLIAGDQFGLAPDGTNTVPAPFQMTRGHTITVIDPATGLNRTGFPKCWDTYGGIGVGAPPTAGVANDIKNAAANDIIAIGTYDATQLSAAMRSAMNTYTGSTSTSTWVSQRISHMFLAKRNSTP